MNLKKMKKIDSKEIKERELKILCYIDQLCKENNIKYTLVGGTLLGAIRHEGFIPWDDDIDIGLLMEDYERLMNVLSTSANKQYRVRFDKNEKAYYYYHAKVVDTETYAIEPHRPKDKNMGVWVDIFPICGIPNEIDQTLFLKKLNKLNSNVFRSIGFNYLYDDNILKSIIKSVILLPVALFLKTKGTKFWKERRYSMYKLKPNAECFCSGFVPTQYNEKTIFPTSIFNSFTHTKFENYSFMIISDWESMLKRMYGNYMELPPLEKRVGGHFEAYLKNNHDDVEGKE